LHKKKKIF